MKTKVIRLSNTPEGLRLSEIFRGSPTQNGRYTGEYSGVEGILISHSDGYFLIDNEYGCASEYSETVLPVDTLLVCPFLALKHRLKVDSLGYLKGAVCDALLDIEDDGRSLESSPYVVRVDYKYYEDNPVDGFEITELDM